MKNPIAKALEKGALITLIAGGVAVLLGSAYALWNITSELFRMASRGDTTALFGTLTFSGLGLVVASITAGAAASAYIKRAEKAAERGDV